MAGEYPVPSRRQFLALAAAATALPSVGPSRAEPRIILNDASRLNATPVARHTSIRGAQNVDDLIARLRGELKEAAAAKRPVAASVARHSMGGQSLPLDGTAVTLDGGPLEILQLWVNLPARLKMTDPRYVGLQEEEIPDYDGVQLIAGE